MAKSIALGATLSFIIALSLAVLVTACSRMSTYPVPPDAPVPRTSAPLASLATHLELEFGIAGDEAWSIIEAAERAAQRHGVALTTLLAVIAVESRFDPQARNGHDRGLMQVNGGWHPEVLAQLASVDALFDIDTNVDAGARILADCLRATGGNLRDALRRYNGMGKRNRYPERVLAGKARLDRVLGATGRTT